ncbi:MAG: peptide deformylase [Spirochaetales bacterium]|nr:peptide deformylase [Spirochaetales bacterium]
MLDIYKLGDDILRQKCKEIKEFDSALAMLADAMIETMDEADGVGLAGPQVGVDKKIFVIHLQNQEPMVFINPEILETSIETGPYEEGCLSLPGVYHNVIRPLRVKIQAQDLKGKAFVLDADGLLARVIQHENDHLKGKLYIDHLNEVEKELIIKAYEKRNSPKKRKSKA